MNTEPLTRVARIKVIAKAFMAVLPFGPRRSVHSRKRETKRLQQLLNCNGVSNSRTASEISPMARIASVRLPSCARHCGSIDGGSEELRLLPQQPAHTDGDLGVFLAAANALIKGDLFTERRFPRYQRSLPCG
jgi:hypothetical protein